MLSYIFCLQHTVIGKHQNNKKFFDAVTHPKTVCVESSSEHEYGYIECSMRTNIILTVMIFCVETRTIIFNRHRI